MTQAHRAAPFPRQTLSSLTSPALNGASLPVITLIPLVVVLLAILALCLAPDLDDPGNDTEVPEAPPEPAADLEPRADAADPDMMLAGRAALSSS